jgi:hypothetical protein
MKRLIGHIVSALMTVVILMGLPLMLSGNIGVLFGNKTDAVTSATKAVDKPSGEYVVFINTSLHTDETALRSWKAFFENGDTDGIINVFEDISCTVASGDEGGLEMAESFMSRLPENQMKVRKEDGTLMISKAENGRFDVIVMSKETAETMSAERIPEMTQAVMLKVKGE